MAPPLRGVGAPTVGRAEAPLGDGTADCLADGTADRREDRRGQGGDDVGGTREVGVPASRRGAGSSGVCGEEAEGGE